MLRSKRKPVSEAPKHAKTKSSRFAAVALVQALVAVGLVLPGLQLANAAITTDPTPDVTGSNTTVTLGGTVIPENGVLQAGGTASVATSVLLNPGLGDREIRTSYDPDSIYVSGSVQAPEGWTLEYSIDNGTSWLSSEPAPASSVTDIRARKTAVAAGVISGYSQNYSSETVSAIPSSTFAASSGGDGWGVDFFDNYILNIYHHTTTVNLECKLKDTGASCAPGTGIYEIKSPAGATYFASMRSDLAVDPAAGKAYVLTAQSNAVPGTTQFQPGALCIDLNPLPSNAPTWCGFVPLTSGADATAYGSYWDVTKAGQRYYSLISGSTPKLMCFDSAANAVCPNTPITYSQTSTEGRTKVFGDQLFVKTDTATYCVLASDPATTCTGWTGGKTHTSDSNSDIAFHANSSRDIDGLCIRQGCWDLAGTLQSSWGNPFIAMSQLGTSYHSANRGVTTLGRYYSPKWSDTNVYCFDFVTGTACKDAAGTNAFAGLTTSNWYMAEVDPENPACLWVNSDLRKIANFDAWTGAAGCASNPVITLQPSQFAPRYACSTADGIDLWNTLQISNLVGTGSAASISLTVRDGQGATVSGWSNKSVSLATPLDMTGLDALVSGSRPTFSFAFNGITGGTITAATISLEYKGKGPELCSEVTIATPSAPATTDVTINSYLIDAVAPAGTYQSQRTFSIDPSASESSASQTVPGAPTSLSGTGLNTSATITFTPPADDGGLAISGYRYSLNGGSSYLSLDTAVDNGDGTSSFVVDGLTAGSTYSVLIGAKNSLGWSASSSALSLTAQLVDFTSLSDTYLSVGTIALVVNNPNGLPYTYLADPSSVCTVSGTTITLVAVGDCKVDQNQAGDANNLATTASATFAVLADPIVISAPSAPLNLTATPASGQVTLSWDAPSATGNGTVSDYVIQYKVGTSWIPFLDGTSTATSLVMTGLTNGAAYDFKIAAVNEAGQGLYSTIVASTPATIAGPATSLAGSLAGDGLSATLAWTAPASNGGSAITDYKVEYKLAEEAAWTLFTDAVSATTGAVVTGLTSGQDYDFQVSVINAAGVSLPVSTVTLRPTNGDQQVGLTWDAPSGAIVNYIVEYRVAGASTWQSFDTTSTATTATLASLSNGTQYDIRVAAMLTGGGVSSYTSTVRGAPFSVAAAPALVATPGIGQVALSWSAPTSNGSAITDYTIEYKAAASLTWIVLTDGVSTLTYATITNLTNGSSYDFRARATNSAGVSSYSSIASATPRNVPGAPTGLALVAGEGVLTYSFTAPTSNGGAAITDYQVQYKLLSSTSWSTLSHAASIETSGSVASLSGLTQYSVRVAAINAAGVGAYGAAASAITLVVTNSGSSGSSGSGVSPNTATLEIAPLKPGQVPLDNAISVKAGSDMKMTGSNLDAVTKVYVGDESVGFEVKDGALSVQMPERMELRAYETTIVDKNGNKTPGPVVDVTQIQTTIGDKDALIKRLPNGEVKVWLFNPINVGKVQFMLKDIEIAWVRRTSTDFIQSAKLRVLSLSKMPYLVRTLRLPEGSIVGFKFVVKGEVIEEFDIEGRPVKRNIG